MDYPRDVYDHYNEMLNEVTPTVKIGDMNYCASTVLREVDPIAYRVGLEDWLDSLASDGRFCYDCEVIGDCECEEEFDHINPSTLYSKFTYVGTDNNPTNFETQSRYMDYEQGKIIGKEKW